ncbi:MAG: iron reductase [Okeania sp. SIO3I5]|uniref:ferric reductase-like transmembrane domain-containing protein n=1 Tax=Okeania sp. SIO3I5 TaxID=2607805 RepID=UPI0013B8088C|nr:ferric reductase-like transmembrane domain-containing protein [Okeania sp. SIO3I5]NEQ41103.1 iron reductase [Okeania sp. SIO3I5]
MLDAPPLANYLGFLALICYVLTLLPTSIKIVFPQTRQAEIPKVLQKNRREIGVIAFVLAFGHGTLLVLKRNFDFYDFQTYWIYIQGVATFIIFVLLTITSNDWSMRKMKKNWKKLHELTYLALFLLVWHIIDKMSGHWTLLTPFGMLGITGIAVVFIIRKWKEHQKKLSKPKPIQ